MNQEILLQVENLKKYFPIKGGVFRRVVEQVHAVDGVSFQIHKGETLSVVGESGCGKSTLGNTLVRLERPTEGTIHFENQEISTLSRVDMQPFRKDIQIIFQDPNFSLNPRHRIERILLEPLEIHHIGEGRKRRLQLIHEVLRKVGLRQDALERYPHEFSGGQRQRIGIARALLLKPKFIVADEPVSALDVSIQSQILNLLKELQKELGLTYLFISHDLAVVEYISDRVMVMYLGEVVELTSRDELFDRPMHPYTQALISAIPEPNPHQKKSRIVLKGDVPSPIHPPKGCRFHPRCPQAMEQCRSEAPRLENHGMEAGSGGAEHWVRCHLYRQSQNAPTG